ncbi:hypothetical protein GCM10023195_51110 [Actinoallomurus liliacearum]|uniref:Uncharacterized protein n=1 Tax=Actinoallomurus liliacearum TaxID=1080073 RepID=A0ABP8TMZ9_9ACTN
MSAYHGLLEEEAAVEEEPFPSGPQAAVPTAPPDRASIWRREASPLHRLLPNSVLLPLIRRPASRLVLFVWPQPA